MADDWGQKAEEMNDFRLKGNGDNSEATFKSSGSAGNNGDKLARILSAYDMAMNILGWDKSLSNIVAGYQASVNSEYHKDHVKISIAERVSVLMKRNIMSKSKGGADEYTSS